MLRIRGATSVAEEQEFVASLETGNDCVDGAYERVYIVAQKGPLHTNAFVKCLGNGVLHQLFS